MSSTTYFLAAGATSDSTMRLLALRARANSTCWAPRAKDLAKSSAIALAALLREVASIRRACASASALMMTDFFRPSAWGVGS